MMVVLLVLGGRPGSQREADGVIQSDAHECTQYYYERKGFLGEAIRG